MDAKASDEAVLSAVAEIGGLLAGEVDQRSILPIVVARVQRLVRASCVYVALWDRPAGMVRFPYYLEHERKDNVADRPFADGLTEHVLRTGRTLRIPRDFVGETQRLGIRWLGTASRSWLGAPMIVRGEPVGVLAVYDNDHEDAFDGRDERILEALAAQAAAALRNADLLADAAARTTRLARQREALRGLATDAFASRPLGAVLARIAREAADTLEVERASVWLFDADRSAIRCEELHERTPRRDTSGLRLSANEYPAYFRALEEDRTIAASDAETDPRTAEFTESYLRPLGIRAMLDAPIRVAGRLVGVVCHEHVGSARRWAPEEEQFAGSVADLVAVALAGAERRAAEEALRAQRDLYDALLTAQSDMGVGFVMIDPVAQRIVYSNEALRRIGGYSETELGGGLLDLVAPEHRAEIAARLRARLAGEPAPESYEIRGHRRDGAAIDLEIAVKPVRSAEGLRLIALVRDITAAKEAERQLRRLTEDLELLVAERTRDLERAKRSLETVFENTVDGFLFVDEHLNLAGANARFAEFFGLSLEEILSGDKADVRRKARERFRKPAAFDDGLTVYEPEHRARPTSATVELVDGRVLQEESRPIFENGRYAGRVWTYHDITERQRLEEELRRYASTLEEEVERRTRTLVQAAKMAALGQLTAGVAHEINNPLAFVKANTAIIREETHAILSEPILRAGLEGHGSAEEALAWLRSSDHWKFISNDVERLLDVNLKGLTRISDIVQRLRSFAAPQAPRMEPTDLRAVVRDTAAIFLAQFAPRIRLTERYEDIPAVVCDGGQVGQVVMNLLVNAGQAIEGDGSVHVALRRDDRSAVLTIADSGLGMTAEVARRVFDPFFTTKDRGTGLGLSISYSIVKEHGGEILVASEPGKGTTMTVRLPIGDGHGG